MIADFSYFRIKLNYRAEQEDGSIASIKPEVLTMATCYTEAEIIANKIASENDTFGHVTFEILKTKIEEVIFNETLLANTDKYIDLNMVEYFFEEEEESEKGLYEVVYAYPVMNEINGKVKMQKASIHVPATSSANAIKNFTRFIGDNCMEKAIIRTVKYDKAKIILVTNDQHLHNK